ncbi:MAG: DUF2283 domain-containing protein [Gemmatimonadetes bacterium]|nr:DUF2283 domain-containing protein [Gemmatimonadota bacterium]
MTKPRIRYDEPSDTLHIAFAPGEPATGIELNEHILLRVDKRESTAVGLTLLNFSLLAQRTEMGPRSFPLTGVATLPPELRELALTLLQSPPVNEYLIISAFTGAGGEMMPITYLQSDKLTSLAA